MQDEEVESNEIVRQQGCCVVWWLVFWIYTLTRRETEKKKFGGGLPMGRREWKRDVPTHPVRGAKIIATTSGLYSMKMKDREVFLREANQLRRKVLGQSHGCMRKD